MTNAELSDENGETPAPDQSDACDREGKDESGQERGWEDRQRTGDEIGPEESEEDAGVVAYDARIDDDPPAGDSRPQGDETENEEVISPVKGLLMILEHLTAYSTKTTELYRFSAEVSRIRDMFAQDEKENALFSDFSKGLLKIMDKRGRYEETWKQAFDESIRRLEESVKCSPQAGQGS